MDKIVNKIVGLGVPGLVLLVAMAVSGWVGAAAITSALAMLGGPFGMLGGIAVLGILSMISQGIAEYGFEALLEETISGLKAQGKTNAQIEKEISYYPISRELKLKIREYLKS
ncbi:MAG: hypothetical protein ACFCAD_20925 [Pleurocapsa sp.]